jgi:hypothetical protein
MDDNFHDFMMAGAVYSTLLLCGLINCLCGFVFMQLKLFVCTTIISVYITPILKYRFFGIDTTIDTTIGTTIGTTLGTTEDSYTTNSSSADTEMSTSTSTEVPSSSSSSSSSNIYESLLCRICNNTTFDVTLSPCGHVCCERCYKNNVLRRCRFCKTPIKKVIKFFF